MIDIRQYATGRHFIMMLLLAATLHVLGGMIWDLFPHEHVEDIPVRTLNIKLGDGEEFMEEGPPAGVPPVQQSIPAAPDTPVPDMVQEALDNALKAPEPAKTEAPAATPAEKAQATPAPSRYVRGRGEGKRGSALGNSSDAAAEVITRYEQTISLWLQRHKIYPDEARAAGIEGDAVVRIRINRTGTILFYSLEKRTNQPSLDDALVHMVRSANPVPPVPAEYPGNLIEFLVPVSFRLE